MRVGEQGLVLVRYTGVSDLETFSGPVTGTRYSFGLFRQKGYVDRRDAAGLMEVTEDGLRVFAYV